jgi:hypothetical protein
VGKGMSRGISDETINDVETAESETTHPRSCSPLAFD